MRVIILTSCRQGFASVCLRHLQAAPGVEVAMVVLSHGHLSHPWKQRRRKLAKTLRIGLLGSLNGIRMRPWFGEQVNRVLGNAPVDELASRAGIRLESTPEINCPRTVELFTEANADLGLSLGNGYIGRRVFSIPRLGMINVHHEVLPRFQGAQSVIWQLYEGALNTGYTVHKIDAGIDRGDILFQEQLPIEFKRTLRETVVHNYARLQQISAERLVGVLQNFPRFTSGAVVQTEGRSFTTPSFQQYLHMERQHRRLSRRSASGSAESG